MSAAETISIDIPRRFIDEAIMKRLDIVAPLPGAAVSYADELPAIGASWQGGIYAGLTLVDNKPMALVLLPGDFRGPWNDAKAWADKQGGALPARFDGLVLLKNLKHEFKEEYYWTSEQHASGSDYAWLQGFYYGGQYDGHTGNDFRARAVRRFAI